MKDDFNALGGVDGGVDPRTGRTLLHQAVVAGDVLRVKALLDAGARLDFADSSGMTSITYACAKRADIFKVLLEEFPDPVAYRGYSGMSVLHVAASAGNLESMALCLEKGLDVNARSGIGGYTPLHRAAEQGHVEAVKVLLDAGADPLICASGSSFSVVHSAAMSPNPDVLRLLAGTEAICFFNEPDSKRNEGKTPLELAISFLQFKNIAPLIEAGALVNRIGGTGDAPLHHVMRMANNPDVIGSEEGDARLKIVQELIDHGADILKSRTEALGDTPLHLAARDAWNGDKISAALLERGIEDIDCRNEMGETPLHYAARFGRSAMVKLLLEKGADPNAKAKTDVTPLYFAVTGNVLASVELLLDAGADPDVKTSGGLLPEVYAERDSIARLIQSVRTKKNLPPKP